MCSKSLGRRCRYSQPTVSTEAKTTKVPRPWCRPFRCGYNLDTPSFRLPGRAANLVA
jgi:hypothetical protein